MNQNVCVAALFYFQQNLTYEHVEDDFEVHCYTVASLPLKLSGKITTSDRDRALSYTESCF